MIDHMLLGGEQAIKVSQDLILYVENIYLVPKKKNCHGIPIIGMFSLFKYHIKRVIKS